MYLTCNPGGVGHSWVKRLFVDRSYRECEDGKDYTFIPANVYDNPVLSEADPEYVKSLETLPEKLKSAWLYGEWGIFEGQFFPEFAYSKHVCRADEIPQSCVTYFAAADYGFDMFALLLCAIDRDGRTYVISEHCESNLTLGEAGRAAERMLSSYPVRYLVLSPDMYNRRQDTGRSGIEIFSDGRRLPPLAPADDRRIQGWRCVREYLSGSESVRSLLISESCENLIRSLPLLLCDPIRAEDASDSPHEVTHSPEALRYALMSRAMYEEEHPERSFVGKRRGIW
jgi:phage terminase large subunit